MAGVVWEHILYSISVFVLVNEKCVVSTAAGIHNTRRPWCRRDLYLPGGAEAGSAVRVVQIPSVSCLVCLFSGSSDVSLHFTNIRC